MQNNIKLKPDNFSVCEFLTPPHLESLDKYFSIKLTTGHHNNCGLDCFLKALILEDKLDEERNKLGFKPKQMLSFDDLCLVAELHQVALLCIQFSDIQICDNKLCYGGSMTFQLYGDENSHDCVVLINTVNHYTLVNSLKRNVNEREIIKPSQVLNFFTKFINPIELYERQQIFSHFFSSVEKISNSLSNLYNI